MCRDQRWQNDRRTNIKVGRNPFSNSSIWSLEIERAVVYQKQKHLRAFGPWKQSVGNQVWDLYCRVGTRFSIWRNHSFLLLLLHSGQKDLVAVESVAAAFGLAVLVAVAYDLVVVVVPPFLPFVHYFAAVAFDLVAVNSASGLALA